MSTEEITLLEIQPSAKGFIGKLVLGVLLTPILVGFVILFGVFVTIKSTRYKLTTQRLFVRKGLIGKKVEELELFRVKDVSMSQGVFQRALGVGDITVLSTDDSTPRLTMAGVADPEAIKEAIRTHYRAARKGERGLTEFVQS